MCTGSFASPRQTAPDKDGNKRQAQRYTCVETLDRDILHTFVERIEIGEKILPEGRKVAGPRTPYRQSIRIFYRFIGEASGDSLRQVQANRDREETVGAAGAF